MHFVHLIGNWNQNCITLFCWKCCFYLSISIFTGIHLFISDNNDRFSWTFREFYWSNSFFNSRSKLGTWINQISSFYILYNQHLCIFSSNICRNQKFLLSIITKWIYINGQSMYEEEINPLLEPVRWSSCCKKRSPIFQYNFHFCSKTCT